MENKTKESKSNQTLKPHILYTNKDKDAPDSIKDRNGDVVLDLCKICGKAESDLDKPCKSSRELAISWWNKEGREQEILAMQYFERSCFNLTGREIEEIWLIEGDYEQAVYNNPSIKDQALEWWNNLSENKQKSLNIKYFGQFDPYEDNSLSNSEIEKIWIKETQEELPNDSTSFEEVMFGGGFEQIAYDNGAKPNQKQLPKELEGVIPRVLTIEEKIEEVKKWHNAKQFKEFNPELFKAYIDKFANENKPDAIKILAESLPNSNLKSYILNWFTV
jgi:hypothetical protein